MRLIDVTGLKTKVKFYHLDGTIKAVVLYEDIMNAPTIEAEPVKRETMSPKKLKAYCPNCGAKMDKE